MIKTAQVITKIICYSFSTLAHQWFVSNLRLYCITVYLNAAFVQFFKIATKYSNRHIIIKMMLANITYIYFKKREIRTNKPSTKMLVGYFVFLIEQLIQWTEID